MFATVHIAAAAIEKKGLCYCVSRGSSFRSTVPRRKRKRREYPAKQELHRHNLPNLSNLSTFWIINCRQLRPVQRLIASLDLSCDKLISSLFRRNRAIPFSFGSRSCLADIRKTRYEFFRPEEKDEQIFKRSLEKHYLTRL